MSKINKDVSLTDQFQAVVEIMNKDKLDYHTQQTTYLGLIAIALCSIGDDLAVLANKEGKNANNKR